LKIDEKQEKKVIKENIKPYLIMMTTMMTTTKDYNRTFGNVAKFSKINNKKK
jgi:hypothetical protein